jgi:hypothetical protein
MRFKPPSTFTILSLDEARRRTGLDAGQLRALKGVEALTRVYADGRREDALRLPLDVLTPPSE